MLRGCVNKDTLSFSGREIESREILKGIFLLPRCSWGCRGTRIGGARCWRTRWRRCSFWGCGTWSRAPGSPRRCPPSAAPRRSGCCPRPTRPRSFRSRRKLWWPRTLHLNLISIICKKLTWIRTSHFERKLASNISNFKTYLEFSNFGFSV